MCKHIGVTGDLGREDFIGVQRVVVARRTRILDNLGSLQIAANFFAVGVADFQFTGF